MKLIQRFYNRSFGDYGVMQSCRAVSDESKEWIALGINYTKQDWQEKHRAWIAEPLPGAK